MEPLDIENSKFNVTNEPTQSGEVPVNTSPSNNVGLAFFTIFLFLMAGIAEIGGGYMIWKGFRDKYKPYLLIPLGSLVLILYGFIPTFQPQNDFGRVYAVYGGFFIILSYIWGYIFDGIVLDTGDYVGSAIALVGVCICWFWPR